MNTQVFIRLILGVVFGLVGFYLAGLFFHSPQEGVNLGFKVVSTAFAGGAGIFLVPIITNWFRHWSGVFAKRVAGEVISQLHLPQIPNISNSVRRIRSRQDSKWVNPMVVDTSSLIDGRLLEVIESGFLFGTLIVPNFILSELQHIADSAQSLKRARGRRGFDVLERIKKSKNVKTVVYDTGDTSLKNIDDRLLKLAKGWHAKIITTDFNLNKVASVSGVKILNVNELANFVKTPLIPGDEIEIKVIQEGKEKTQGVGYLPDGTMIVVEGGLGYVGKNVVVSVSRVLQTAAGRMIFAKFLEDLKV